MDESPAIRCAQDYDTGLLCTECDSLCAEQGCGLDAECAAGRKDCGEDPDSEHGSDNAGEDKRIAGACLVDDGGEDAGAGEAEQQSERGANEDDDGDAAERRIEDAVAGGAEGEADAEVAHAACDRIGRESEDAGHGERQREHATLQARGPEFPAPARKSDHK